MCFEPPFIGENLFILGNTIVHNKPKSIPKTYSTKLCLFIEKLLAKSTDNRPSAKEALRMIPRAVKAMDRFKNKKEDDENVSDVNISAPYEPSPKNSGLGRIVPQSSEDLKNRPISAAVIRSNNVKIKEPVGREFKIGDLEDEKQVKRIIERNDYQDNDIKPLCKISKEPSLPVKASTDKALSFQNKKSQKSFSIKRLS